MVTNRAETDEQKTEELNAPRSSIFKTANGENHEIKGDLFDNQILEIDIELRLCNEIKALIQKFYWGRRGSKEKSIGKNGKFFVRQNQREG